MPNAPSGVWQNEFLNIKLMYMFPSPERRFFPVYLFPYHFLRFSFRIFAISALHSKAFSRPDALPDYLSGDCSLFFCLISQTFVLLLFLRLVPHFLKSPSKESDTIQNVHLNNFGGGKCHFFISLRRTELIQITSIYEIVLRIFESAILCTYTIFCPISLHGNVRTDGYTLHSHFFIHRYDDLQKTQMTPFQRPFQTPFFRSPQQNPRSSAPPDDG